MGDSRVRSANAPIVKVHQSSSGLGDLPGSTSMRLAPGEKSSNLSQLSRADLRTRCDELLGNPLVVPAYPLYLSGFVHALEPVPALTDFVLEMVSNAFGRLPDLVLLRGRANLPRPALGSVLQTDIRRGNVDNAVLAAYQMLSTSADVAEHLWRRLKVIAVENVGMGNRWRRFC